jgi:Caspase domain
MESHIMTFSQGHALVIGIGSYTNAPHLEVPITIADAQAVAAVLRDPQYCGYPATQVTLLHGAAATRAAILSALDDLAARTTADDTVVLFYSGHGHTSDDGSYYLTSHDTRIDNHQVVSGTGVHHQELLDRLRKLPARRVLLIFNACQAGTISPTLDAADLAFTGRSLPGPTTAALLATGEGRVIITACREHQYAYIGNSDLTIFSQALVDGLRGHGINHQVGYISAFDLYTYIYLAVVAAVGQLPEVVRRRYSDTQEPELTVLKGVGPFAVARYQGTAAPGERAILTPATTVPIREIDPAESERALLQILATGDHGVSIAGNVRDSNIRTGDQVEAREGASIINKPAGPVAQRIIDTGGGAYTEGNLSQQGAFVTGSSIGGSVIGTCSGGSIDSAITGSVATLPEICAQIQAALVQAQRQGNVDLSDELQGIALDLTAALRAEGAGDSQRRAIKLQRAQQDLDALAQTEANLRVLAQRLLQLR